MPFPFYSQPDAMDCGPTCLRMVAKHYKRSISLQALREKAGIGKEGVNLLGISEAAEAIGFRTQGVKLDCAALLRDAQLPAVLHWNQNHFVVLYAVRRGMRGGTRLHIADPAKGLLVYTEEEFRECWVSDKAVGRDEGIALLLQPTPALYQQDEPEEKGTLGWAQLGRYLLPFRKLALQLCLGLGISSLLQLMLPFLTKSIVDVGVNTANIHFVYIVLLAQLALFGGRLAVEFVRSWILLHISTRINLAILTDFLIKLMKLPVSFFDSKHTGDILQRMNDHSRIESFLTGTSLNTLFSLLNLVVFSVVLVVFNTTIFGVFFGASLLYGVWVVVFLRQRRILDYKRFDIAAKEQGAAIQLVQGMQEIKLHGVERSMRWAWEGLQARLFGLSVKSLSLTQWQQAGAFFINEGKNIFITFLAAKAVIEGHMTLGTMLAVQYIMGQLNSPIEQLVQFVQSWQNAKISMDRLNEIHTLEDEEPVYKQLQHQLPTDYARQLVGGKADTPLATQNPELLISQKQQPFFNTGHAFNEAPSFPFGGMAGSIGINNLSFTYPGAGNEPVLRHINMFIPEGKTTAIVGASGSGKTTLLKLLLKFYEPQQGSLTLGGMSFKGMSHRHWRSQCGVVMQESFIFSDTIARNIAIGAQHVDRERLHHAVVVANIEAFIQSLPLGFNTKIGAEGMGISMGQKQRILIARAVYRNPDYIFFDEATNSLDANNESLIVRNLSHFFSNKTVVVVAHRLSTVKNAHQIVVLHQGEVVEQGTHQELVNRKGAYYQLVQNQLELGN